MDRGHTFYNGVLGQYDPAFSPSYPIGPAIPWLSALADPGQYVRYVENFPVFVASGAPWTTTQKTAGTAALSATAAGTLLVDADSTTQHQGAQTQHQTARFFCKAGGKLYWHTRFKIVDTFDKANIFLGMGTLDTAILTTGALAVTDFIGFTISTAGAGALKCRSCKGGVAQSDTAITIAEDTFVDLAIVVDGVSEIQFWVNNVRKTLTNIVPATHIPVGALYPAFGCETDGTNDPIMHVQGFQVLQSY